MADEVSDAADGLGAAPQGGPPPPVPPTSGWKLDPFGRFSARFWDGSQWSEQVLDHDGHLAADDTPRTAPTSWLRDERRDAHEARGSEPPLAQPSPPPYPPGGAGAGVSGRRAAPRGAYSWFALASVAVVVVGVLVATGTVSIDRGSSESPRVATDGSSGLRAGEQLSVDTLQAAATNTRAAESAQFTMSMSFQSAGQRIDMHAAGAVAQDGRRAGIEIDIPGVGRIEERILDDSVYLSLDGFPLPDGSVPAGKHWLRMDVGDLARASGLDLNTFREQAQSSTPAQGLAYLHGLSGAVERVGDEVLHGAHATHYRASIDYATAVDELPNLTAQARQRLATLGRVPADVWIDDYNRVVKMQFSVDGSAFGSGHAEMTMEISDFGAPVVIEAPPADQVISISELPTDGIPA
jgi:hypothetical protein